MATAYPLQWPEGWPRTGFRRQSRYRSALNASKLTVELVKSMRLFGADRDSIIVSTNIELKSNGVPYANQRAVDPGVAVYWVTREYGEKSIACDKWVTVQENLHALRLSFDAFRLLQRAGATQVLERAFTAFGELPGAVNVKVERPWYEVFGFPKEFVQHLTLAMAEAKYRELAGQVHPDKTGSDTLMVELNKAHEKMKNDL